MALLRITLVFSILAALVFPAMAAEPVGFSLNRGWPDIGRALSGSLGAGELNPASISMSHRFEMATAMDYDAPSGDYGVHLGAADSHNASLAGEVSYSYLQHNSASATPGSYIETATHRLHFGFSEFYGDVVHFGARAGFDSCPAGCYSSLSGASQGFHWTYGIGLVIPIKDLLWIGLESGDWFLNKKSQYQFGRLGASVGLTPLEFLALVGDVVYRWYPPYERATGIQATKVTWGAGVAVRYHGVVEWRAGYKSDKGRDGNVISTALQGTLHPWMIAGDFRYTDATKTYGIGLTISRLFFTDEEE